MKREKTNAMRLLDQQNIDYQLFTYKPEEMHLVTADKNVFKTLLLQGISKEYYVCVIPVDAELDLKKLAKIVGEKRVQLIPVEEMNQVSGYIRGGCSPIGMKKHFPTWLDDCAKKFASIRVSGGKIGVQIELAVDDLQQVTKAKFAQIIR